MVSSHERSLIRVTMNNAVRESNLCSKSSVSSARVQALTDDTFDAHVAREQLLLQLLLAFVVLDVFGCGAGLPDADLVVTLQKVLQLLQALDLVSVRLCVIIPIGSGRGCGRVACRRRRVGIGFSGGECSGSSPTTTKTGIPQKRRHIRIGASHSHERNEKKRKKTASAGLWLAM